MYLGFSELVSIKAMYVNTVTACCLPCCSRRRRLREAKCIAQGVDVALLLRRLASFHCLGGGAGTGPPAARFSVESPAGSRTDGSALGGLPGSKHAIAPKDLGRAVKTATQQTLGARGCRVPHVRLFPGDPEGSV